MILRNSLRLPGPARWRLAFCLLPLWPGALRPLAAAEGERVLAIRLDISDAHLSLDDFADRITQRLGEPLDPAKVRTSLKNLYATGRFQELRAEAESVPGGLILRFAGTATFFIGSVQVEKAPRAISASALASAARLRVGYPLSEEALAAARNRMLAALASNGYHNARLETTIQRDPENAIANILFTVQPGRPAALGQVDFPGFPPAEVGRLMSLARWRRGMQLTEGRLERGLTRIQKAYVQQGYLQCRVSAGNRTYDAKHQTESVVVRIEPGPIVEVQLKGAHITQSRLRTLLPIYRDGLTDDLTLQQGQRRLQDDFARRGYFFAQVDWSRASSGAKILVTYTVKPGPRGEFAGVEVKGAHSISRAEVNSVLSLPPASSFRGGQGFSRTLLEHDVNALTDLYKSRGFLDVRVSPRLNSHYQGRPNSLFVILEVEEGPRTTVGKLSVHGIDSALGLQLGSLMQLGPGKPYSPVRAEADREVMLGFLADHGYSNASVTWTASPPSDRHTVDLEYQVELGLREKVGRVVLVGNTRTRPSVVRRELTFSPGQDLSQTALVESQSRLYNLGVFSQVQISPLDPAAPEAHKTVLVSMEEARRWTIGYGGGVDLQRLENSQPQGQYGASPRLSFDLTRLNMRGLAQTFSLRGRLSNLETGGSASYYIPRFRGRQDLELRLTALSEQVRDVLTFTSRRSEVSATVQKRYSKSTSLVAGYSYRLVSVTNLKIQPESIPLLSQPVRVATVGSTYINDHRDNPADATQGSFSLADAAVAWTGFGSQADFVRLSGQNSTYYRLGSHIIFARNTRLGLESVFGGLREVTTPQGTTLTHAIPLAERFFMGGSESHRGFSLNQAGPRDPITGFPVGGEGSFLNTLELRFPMRANRYGLVLFHDAGNVFSSVRRMELLKFSQRSPTDFNYLSHALGAGLRYRTPLGPLRFDVGYNFNPTQYEVCSNPSVTVCPTQNVQLRRLSRVQFSLSVGQSF
jgi:outer membrane protein insertion porin family